MTYNPRSQSRPLPARGAPNSAELRATQDQMIRDIQGVAAITNSNEAELEQLRVMLFTEMRALKSASNAFWDTQKLQSEGMARIVSGMPYIYINTMSNTTDAYHHLATPPEHQSTINNDFRMIVLPKNNVLSLFYDLPSDRPGEIVSREPDVTVEPTAEYDGVVTTGTPLNAFNGNNTSIWVRKLSFPLHHDVTEVSMDIIIDVPSGTLDGNTLQLIPYPFDSITVNDIQYTSDFGEGWQTIAALNNFYGYDDSQGVRHFQPIKNLQPIQLMLPNTRIARLKISVSQDNWIEENGRKVFYYGFQEIGLLFVEWEDTKDATSPFDVSNNNNILFQIDSPDGYEFTGLSFFESYPYDDASASQALLWQLGTDQYDFGLKNQIWTSLLPKPQAGVTIPITNKSSVYAKCILNMAVQDSPFMIGTPAFVNSFMAHFTLQAAV